MMQLLLTFRSKSIISRGLVAVNDSTQVDLRNTLDNTLKMKKNRLPVRSWTYLCWPSMIVT